MKWLARCINTLLFCSFKLFWAFSEYRISTVSTFSTSYSLIMSLSRISHRQKRSNWIHLNNASKNLHWAPHTLSYCTWRFYYCCFSNRIKNNIVVTCSCTTLTSVAWPSLLISKISVLLLLCGKTKLILEIKAARVYGTVMAGLWFSSPEWVEM